MFIEIRDDIWACHILHIYDSRKYQYRYIMSDTKPTKLYLNIINVQIK